VFFVVLSSGIPSTCPNRRNLTFIIYEIVSGSLYRSINTSLVRILHTLLSFTGPNIFSIFSLPVLLSCFRRCGLYLRFASYAYMVICRGKFDLCFICVHTCICMQPACLCVCVCVCDMYRILGPLKLSDGPLTERYCYEVIIEHNSLAEWVRCQRLLVWILVNKFMTMKWTV